MQVPDAEGLEKLKARTASAEKSLADLEQDVAALRWNCQSSKVQAHELKKALEDSIPLGDHYQILRLMSQEHLAATSLWEQREKALEPAHRTRYEESTQRLQATLAEREGQLKELGDVSPQLQRTGVSQRSLEEKSVRLKDQLQQLANVQTLISSHQSQAETMQISALECWRQLQGKLWEAEDLRVEGAALKHQWQCLTGAPATASGVIPAPTTFMASPARQLFLAHLDALDRATGSPTRSPPRSGQASPSAGGNVSSPSKARAAPWVPTPNIFTTALPPQGASGLVPLGGMSLVPSTASLVPSTASVARVQSLRSGGQTPPPPPGSVSVMSLGAASASVTLPNHSAPASPGYVSMVSTTILPMPMLASSTQAAQPVNYIRPSA